MKNTNYIASIGDQLAMVIDDSKLAKAHRVYVAEVKLEEIGQTPEVFIRPSVLESPRSDVPHSRKNRFLDIPFDLLLVGRVDGYDIADVDEIVAVYLELDQYIYDNGRVLEPDYGGIATWIASNIDTTFSQENLRSSNVVQVSGQIVYRRQN